MNLPKMMRSLKYYLENISIFLLVKNWWIVILGYLKLIDLSDGVFLYLKDGLKFLVVHHLDALVLREIIWDNEYKFAQTKSPMTIVDIGANIGTFSIFTAKKNTKNRIFSFEPSPTTFSQFKKNLCINDIENVTPINIAIFSKKTKIKLYENGMSGQRSVYSVGKSKKYTEIQTDTLEHQIKVLGIESIDFLKLDCEGSEYEILLKMKKSTLGKIKRIAMEYHELTLEQNKDQLVQFLIKNDYKVEFQQHNIEKDIGYIWATKK